jgi:lipoate---protein ligase
MAMQFGRIIRDSPSNANMGLAIDHSLLLKQESNIATVRFWSNPRSVVIGRGQFLKLEVDQDFCRENDIRICRRISGGGAVYQDKGNLNISLIYPRQAFGRPCDVREATRLLPGLLKESLGKCGFEKLSLDNLNGIYIDGYKISGAASYLSRDTVLSHSTLLISTNLANLERSLLHTEGAQRGSRYSPTKNLSTLHIANWKSRLIQLLEERFDAPFKEDSLTPEESQLAERLRETLYSRDSWIMEGKYSNPQATERV